MPSNVFFVLSSEICWGTAQSRARFGPNPALGVSLFGEKKNYDHDIYATHSR